MPHVKCDSTILYFRVLTCQTIAVALCGRDAAVILLSIALWCMCWIVFMKHWLDLATRFWHETVWMCGSSHSLGPQDCAIIPHCELLIVIMILIAIMTVITNIQISIMTSSTIANSKTNYKDYHGDIL